MSFYLDDEYGYCEDIPTEIIEQCIELRDTDEDGVHDLFIDLESLSEYVVSTSTDVKLLEQLIQIATKRLIQLQEDRKGRLTEWNVLGDK